MKEATYALLLLLALGHAVPAAAQPLERRYCPPSQHPERCRPPACVCSDDALRLSFADTDSNIWTYESFEPDATVEMTVLLELETEFLDRVVFGVKHDPRFLALEDVTLEGTDVEAFFPPEECYVGTARSVDDGFINHFLRLEPAFGCAFVPPGTTYILVRARYRLLSDPGPRGTRIEFTDELAVPNTGGLRVPIRVHDGHGQAQSQAPAILVDGIIRRKGAAFRRGDADQNGELEVADATTILGYLFLGEARPVCPVSFDVDGSEAIDITDAVRVLLHMFHGRPIPEPFSACGEALDSALYCESFTPCDAP